VLTKIQYGHVVSVSVSVAAESVNTVSGETENVILAAVLITTVTGKSGFGRTLQAGIIILKSIGVCYFIVFAKYKCSDL